jgi:hypothetical protein
MNEIILYLFMRIKKSIYMATNNNTFLTFCVYMHNFLYMIDSLIITPKPILGGLYFDMILRSNAFIFMLYKE